MTSRRFSLDDLKPAQRAEVVAQLSNVKHPTTIAVERADIPAPASKPIRQRKGDGFNKWEREFLGELQQRHVGSHIHREVALPLANGTAYKVDFLVAKGFSAEVLAYEVKGRRLSTGIVKLKVAASLYPWIKFHLVTREAGEWRDTEVLP